MARRSDHSREELTHLAVQAGIDIIESNGLAWFSARQVANRIGYTVGTISHVFGGYDGLLLHINARTLDMWFDRLSETVSNQHGETALKAMAADYLRFAADHGALWSALFVPRTDPGFIVPDWYQQKFQRFFALVERIILPMVGWKQKTAHQAARALWAGIHGICMLSLGRKLELTDIQSAESLAQSFVETYLKGLQI